VGIGTGIHYPIPLHLQRAYASMGFSQESFPVSEQAASRALSLPMFPTLTSDAQRPVAARVRQCVDERPVRAHVGKEASA
jgi:dTDP-4-amino-4,6-dideoxygalactose transaminase